MQLNLVTFLMGDGAPVAANATPSSEEGSGNFARLLGDATSGQGGQQGGGALPGEQLAATALIAQELDPGQLAALQGANGDKLAQLLDKTITPQDAKGLLAQLDAMPASDDGLDQQAFNQLKQSLQELAESKQAAKGVPVASLLEKLPAVAQAETPAERAPLLQQLLGWVQTAIDQRKEASQQAAGLPDSTVQSLQASLFPAGDAAASAAQKEDKDKTDDAQALTVIVPLAHTQIASAMPEWVKKLGEGQDDVASDEIKDAIPALTLPQDDSLPEVKLPGREEIAAGAMADKTEGKKTGKEFHDALQALSDTADMAQATTAPVANDATHVQALAAVQHSNTTSAAAPLSHGAMAHLTPHTTATEQVQVAITSATKDGIDKITLQLEPAELGRVEVSMQIGADGKTHVSFLADRPDTLDALSRDARSLERSLQEAGVKADAGSMQFNLRQQPQPQFGQGFGDGQRGQQQAANDNDDDIPAAAAALDGVTRHYTINVREGVDIHA